jgi:hypothetical protein
MFAALLPIKTIRFFARLAMLCVLTALPATTADDDEVFLSATGAKYHRASCRTMKYKPTPIGRKDAEKGGYAACKICRP